MHGLVRKAIYIAGWSYPIDCSRVECLVNHSLKWVVYWYTTLCFVVPVRGHALISLRRLLEDRDPEALEKQEVLLKVFQENIDHADTYIYLAAVQVRFVPGKYWPNWYVHLPRSRSGEVCFRTILTKLIRTFTSQPSRWSLFQENIDQTDTYIYLAAIEVRFVPGEYWPNWYIHLPRSHSGEVCSRKTLTTLIRTSTSQPFRWGLFQENIDQTDAYIYLAAILMRFVPGKYWPNWYVHLPRSLPGDVCSRIILTNLKRTSTSQPFRWGLFQDNIDHADTYIYLAAIQVRFVPGKYWPNWYVHLPRSHLG